MISVAKVQESPLKNKSVNTTNRILSKCTRVCSTLRVHDVPHFATRISPVTNYLLSEQLRAVKKKKKSCTYLTDCDCGKNRDRLPSTVYNTLYFFHQRSKRSNNNLIKYIIFFTKYY